MPTRAEEAAEPGRRLAEIPAGQHRVRDRESQEWRGEQVRRSQVKRDGGRRARNGEGTEVNEKGGQAGIKCYEPEVSQRGAHSLSP